MSAPPIRVERIGCEGGAEASDTLTLDHAARHVRRKAFTCDGGTRVALDQADAMRLRDGDRLVLEDGREIAVRAADEALTEVTASDPARLAEFAWHIGNRHTPCRVEPGRILIARDPVLARMLEGLGAGLREVTGPFEPMGGAYHSHGHSHGEPHGHDH